ncbi:hypothetical protein JTE90_011660 [Oedothorax gibbosus]|uniref:Secreted protein n=1 Tax=Oedothorax gibbosus TaxID=931172 RepID=A0AAV6TSU5_9ARAC|nr:hypothetical protein JTE90_011660 [Oedothorax gibbosus]
MPGVSKCVLPPTAIITVLCLMTGSYHGGSSQLDGRHHTPARSQPNGGGNRGKTRNRHECGVLRCADFHGAHSGCCHLRPWNFPQMGKRNHCNPEHAL